jgi:hypothetical protein
MARTTAAGSGLRCWSTGCADHDDHVLHGGDALQGALLSVSLPTGEHAGQDLVGAGLEEGHLAGPDGVDRRRR